MGGTKYHNLLGNKYIRNYKNSLSLTKLAIPKLDDSITRYLNALKPLLSDRDWKHAEEIAKDFQQNEGVELDKEIRELDKKEKDSNYISEPWFDMYLKARESIVLNYNPFIAFKPDPNPNQMNQAIRASNFLIAAVRFLNSLRTNKLKPEIFHLNPEKSDTIFFQRLMRIIPESVSFYGAYMFNAYPLDMSQYFRLFNSTRIPKKGKDILVTDKSKTHILVLHKGNFFTFSVLDKNEKLLEPEEILACFRYILDSNQKPAEFPIGVLTSENRDKWADVRSKLESLGNESALKAIDSALFCIALDDTDSNDPSVLAPNFLYGNPSNRWFDKNHTLIINKNGQAAVNFEHSWGDGVAVLRFFNEIYDDSTKNQFVNSKTKPSFDKGDMNQIVKKLEFKLDESVKVDIKQALVNYNEATQKVNLRNFEQEKYGRKFVKKFNISPDSLMQSAIQVAFYQVFGKFVATYESASTSAFKYGRTETIRPATLSTKRLAEFFFKNTNSIDSNEFLKLMLECTKLHNQLVKEGAMGQGFDRHLFALKYHAVNRKKQSCPKLFESYAYKFINHNVLSTSTLAYPTILTGGFAPVVPDGFGVGYRILDDTLGACVSCYNPSDLKLFVDALENTYERFYEILNKTSPIKKD